MIKNRFPVLRWKMFTHTRSIILLSTVLLFACSQEEAPPRLVIMISMDHLAYHSYEHYSPIFTSGFKWLADHGISFDNAHLEHGNAATGPGHFVLGSGLHPGPAEMLGNSWYDRRQNKDIYCVEDPNAKALEIPANSVSYQQLNATTFGDWLKATSPGSKVYSVACKDRAAILMGGKNPDLAIWYNWRGAFTTTDYYTDSIPTWLTEFNSSVNMISYRDSIWTKSYPESLYASYAHADSFYGETDRYLSEEYSPVFPIGFEATWDDKKIFEEMGGRPWMDRITLDLASTIVNEANLGKDDMPDVLCVGLSTMDIIAHYYGPYSHEAMDLLLKVDQYLGEFLQGLDQQIGLENVTIVMTTDHGGLPLPEHWTGIMGEQGGRVDEAQYLATRAKAYNQLDSLYGNHDFILRKGSAYYYDYQMLDSMGVDMDRVNSIIQSHMESVDGVSRVYTKAELLHPKRDDPSAIRLSHFTHPDLSPDLYTLLERGWLFRNPFGTSHGTPYDYDSHVPLIFSRLSYTPVMVTDSVATIDIAATLGDILGVKPLNPIDGKSLIELFPGAVKRMSSAAKD
ncbi:MAG: alkaline phosphatase family protein [Candidatus Marinimicrobia bacterium]|nr:alkaline phosphatase family protein [Candidatus Neomarinimicrobiota bacterium]